MTRREAYDHLVFAKVVLIWMKHPREADFLNDAAVWIDPSFTLVTLEEIQEQAKRIRSFAMKKAPVQGAFITRVWLFLAELLRSIEA